VKDEKGLYYYPSMQTHDVRMYVRATEAGDIEFRMWHKSMPEVWEKHEWIPIDVVKAAADMYDHPDRNPVALYDLDIAKRLIAEGK
jgi:hypothetical protein